MKPITVAHSFDVWLPLTMTWAYNQLRYAVDVDSIVLAMETANHDTFPWEPVYSASRLERMRVATALHAGRPSYPPAHGAAVHKHHPALLHSHFGYRGWMDLPLAHHHHLRHVVTFYGQDVGMFPQAWPAWRRRYEKMFVAVDLVLCEGPYMRGSLIELGCPPSKVEVQPLGVDLERLPCRVRQPTVDEPVRILLAAAFRPKKGIPSALEAVAAARDAGLKVRATIAGGSNGGPVEEAERVRIERAIRTCGLDGIVDCIGMVPYERLLGEMYRHHIFLSPSIHGADGDCEGGAPVTLIEASASGMPVVSTKHCDIPHVVENGVTGLLAPEGDQRALNECLCSLLANPGRWALLGEAGAERARRLFDARVCAAGLSDTYRRVARLGASGTRPWVSPMPSEQPPLLEAASLLAPENDHLQTPSASGSQPFDDMQLNGPADQKSLTFSTISSSGWRAMSVLGGAVLQFAVSIVMARLLTPTQFGTFGLVLVVVGLINMLAFLGVGPALVQRRDLTEEHIRSAWTISLIGGFVAAVAMAAAAPLLALLVGDTETTAVFRAISPIFILVGIRTCSLSLLRRNLRFRILTLVDILSYAVGYAAVGVTLAVLGWGLWALVAAALGQALLATTLTYAVARHPLTLGLSRLATRQVLGFGGAITLSGLANYVALNGDNFIVGRVLGPAALGFYARAYNLMNLPFNFLGQIIGTVLLPAFSRVQDSRERLKRSYIVSVYLVFLVAAPSMAFVVVAAPAIIVGIYGVRWSGTIAPLQVLALFGALRATYHLGGPLAQAGGRQWSEFVRQLLYAVLVLVGGWFGTRWGTSGVAWAVGIAITVMYVAMAQLSHQVAGFTWRSFAAAHRPGLVAGIAVLAAVELSRVALDRLGAPTLSQVFVLLAVSVAVVAIVFRLLPLRWAPEGAGNAISITCDLVPRPLRGLARRLARAPATPADPQYNGRRAGHAVP